MKNSNIILYSFRRCPYAMRARMALKYTGVELHHREILLKDKPKSMLNYSAKGTVPVLVVGEKVIDESLDVMHWALAKQDNDNWLISDNKQLQSMQLELIQTCDNTFKSQLDHYKYSDRYPKSEIEYRNDSLWFLEKLNNHLSSHYFLMNNKVSMADIAIFPFIRQYAFVNKPWFDATEYKNLQKWLEHWLKSELFLSIMQKHPLWKDI